MALALYLLVQTTVVLALGSRPGHSPLCTVALTAAAMFSLAAGKARTGRALDNPVLVSGSRVTTIDALPACAVLAGVTLDAVLGWWWADPAAGLVIVCYAIRDAAVSREHA